MIRLSFETSGTTGEPKRVEHTLEAMIANAKAFNALAGLDKDTVMYHCLPQTHMAGFLNTILCPTLAGGRVVFGRTFSAKTATTFWSDVISSGADTVWITPTIAAAVLRLQRQKTFMVGPSNVFCGTAPLPFSTRKQWMERFGIPLRESYGTSEHMLVSVQSWEDAAALQNNAGSLLPGIVAASSVLTGELVVDSDYSKHDGHTGDIGECRDGRLTITGRSKDFIKRGGVRVSPSRIEETLRGLPGIHDAAVLGEPDAFWGERILAFVEGLGDMDTVRAMVRACDLPESHRPDRIVAVDRLPRNAMGKVRKSELRSIISA